MSPEEIGVLFILFSLPVLNALVGAAIGKRKGRQGAGAILGFLVGPIGWVLIYFGPNSAPVCPMCKGEVVAGAQKCKNCGSNLQPTAALR